MVASLTAAYANCQSVWLTVGAHVEWLGDYTMSGQQLQQVLTIARGTDLGPVGENFASTFATRSTELTRY